MINYRVEEVERLDKFLTSKVEETRSQVEHFIKNGNVSVNGKIIKKSGYKLRVDDEIVIDFPEIEKKESVYCDFDVEIIYEDDDILVINKPSGLVIHPAPSVKEPTLVDWLKQKGIALSNISGEERHGIVHRIDKETTGALVIAKNNEAHQKLSEQLQDKSMGRIYLALIDLRLRDDIEIDKRLGRNSTNRLKRGVTRNGKDAKTRFIKLVDDEESKNELIACKLFTGRTHQIRAHLAIINRHIVGDVLYGFKKDDKIPRIMLHAYYLYLIHPKTGKKMFFKAELAEDMLKIMKDRFKKDRYEEIDIENILNRFDEFDGSRLY